MAWFWTIIDHGARNRTCNTGSVFEPSDWKTVIDLNSLPAQGEYKFVNPFFKTWLLWKNF
jgi:hypothetical protein